MHYKFFIGLFDLNHTYI